MPTETITLVLYTRPGCCLCDRLEELLAPGLARLRKSKKVELIKRNIEGDESLEMLYGERIPVLVHEGKVVLEGRPDSVEVIAAMARLK